MPLVAFRFGSTPLFSYSLFLALGLLFAALDLQLEGRQRGWSAEEPLAVMAWALAPAVLLGRLGYVATQEYDGARHLGLLIQPWGEGYSCPAAIAGGALGLAAFCAWRKHRFMDMAGAIVPGLAFGQALAWFGAAVHGAYAGVALPISYRWAPQMRDLYGYVVPRFPLQLAAGGLCLLLWALLARGVRSGRQRLACYAIVSGLGLAVLDAWREVHLTVFAGLSAEQIGYLALALAGLALGATALLRHHAPRIQPETP